MRFVRKLNKVIVFVFFLGCVLVKSGFGEEGMTWQKINSFGLTGNIRCLTVEEKTGEVWAGTKDAVYRIAKNGETKAVLGLSGQNSGVNKIVIAAVPAAGGRIGKWFGGNGNNAALIVYAVADNALYQSKDSGKRWEKIFSANEEKLTCLTVAVNQGFVFLGTSDGVWFSSGNNIVWQKMAGPLAEKSIYKIEFERDSGFAVTDKEVWSFVLRPGETGSSGSAGGADGKARNIFALVGHEYQVDGDNGGANSGLASRRIKDFKVGIDPVNKNTGFFVATDNGVYFSGDQGHSWERLAVEGLPFKEIMSLALIEASDKENGHGKDREGVSQEASAETGRSEGNEAGAAGNNAAWRACPQLGNLRILVGTQKGVFVFIGEYWRPVYQGMETVFIADLATASQKIYAASGNGVFVSGDKMGDTMRDTMGE